MAVGPTMRRIFQLIYDSTAKALKVRAVDATNTDVIGAVTASPTSNTVLDRLKTIATNISNLATTVVLAAGTAVIGKVRLVTATGDEITDDTADAIKAKLSANSGVDIGDVDVTSIATGTNAIGRVGHDTTGLGHGVKTVSTVGADEALAASTACKWVIIQAQTDNTDKVAVGASGVDATVATGTGILLDPGDAFTFIIDNLADVFVDALVAGEGVRYTYGS